MSSKRPRVTVDLTLTGQLATKNGARLHYTFSVPPSITVGHIAAMLRKSIKLNEAEAIFIYGARAELMPMSTACGVLSRQGKVVLSATSENAFGGLDLPPDLMALVRDFLMPSKADTRLAMARVFADLDMYSEIRLPSDNYSIREVTAFINQYCSRRLLKDSSKASAGSALE